MSGNGREHRVEALDAPHAGVVCSIDHVAQSAEENPFVRVLRTIWDGPKPVLARVNGQAFGGGVGLAAACDVAIAVDTAVFAFSEVRVGVVAGGSFSRVAGAKQMGLARFAIDFPTVTS